MSRFETTRMSLILRLRNRSDTLSWNDFHRKYGELLVRYARSIGASPVDAEDIVQEVEMYLFKALDGFEYDVSKGRFRSYLRTAVLHAYRRRRGRYARQGRSVDPQTFDYISAGHEAETDERWEREWRLHRLRWALRIVAKSIEPVTLKAFQMHVLDDRPAGETAEALAISKASVYQAKSRVLRRVKEELDRLDPDDEV
jgi:RNA polymerase sigma-70 factor (ECF subfamily)